MAWGDVSGAAAAAETTTMERDGEQLSARPALETEGLRFLHVTVGSLLATYGWYIIFSCILFLVVIQKLSARFRALRQRQLDQETTVVEPDIIVKRQEALAAARLKMQEELNAQAEKHKEKLRQLEEERRRLKIVKWDSMQEGKSYKGNVKKPQEEDNSVPSTSSVPPKRKPERKPLRRGGYNPLSGEGGGACSWRPGRRGPSSGG